MFHRDTKKQRSTELSQPIQRTFSKDHDISGEYDGWVGVSQDRNTQARSKKGKKAWHLQG